MYRENAGEDIDALHRKIFQLEKEIERLTKRYNMYSKIKKYWGVALAWICLATAITGFVVYSHGCIKREEAAVVEEKARIFALAKAWQAETQTPGTVMCEMYPNMRQEYPVECSFFTASAPPVGPIFCHKTVCYCSSGTIYDKRNSCAAVAENRKYEDLEYKYMKLFKEKYKCHGVGKTMFCDLPIEEE